MILATHQSHIDKGNAMRTKFIILTTMVLGCVSSWLSAQEVFTWKDNQGIANYSDVPRDMKPGLSNLVNIRTHSEKPAVAPLGSEKPESLAEQQMKLNQQLAEKNKAIEERNKQIQEDNCKAARMNLNLAQKADSDNRDALVSRYQSEINKYCN